MFNYIFFVHNGPPKETITMMWHMTKMNLALLNDGVHLNCRLTGAVESLNTQIYALFVTNEIITGDG